VYDKGAEQSDQVGRIWRYEVEVKKPASEIAVARLLEEKNPAEFIGGFVHGWFVRHGIHPVFSPTSTESVIEVGTRVKSSDKTLEWLSTQVRPAVGRLIIEGREAELLEALGLPDYVKRFQLKLEEGL
jgi:DNA relaxase NicK